MKLLHSIQGLFYTLTLPTRAKSINEVAQQLRRATSTNRYRVRHVDGLRVRRVLVVSAPNRTVAQALVEQLIFVFE